MRFVLFSLIVLMLTAGFAMAEKPEKKEKPREGFRKERVHRIRSGKYSRMLISMVQKTGKLDLTEQQKDRVNTIRSKYISPIISEENQSRALQRKFMSQLHDPQFNPSTLKTTAKETDEANAKIADMFIDGMAALREAVGPKNYAKLTPAAYIDRRTLIKLKNEEMARVQKQAAESNANKEPASKSNTSE
ncbi:MAG: hypothetical protein KAI07_05850 [Deltaproteobacteria bacterium]|nr:hypothetical protein [Deltaproteobacteria bacterium]